MCFSQELLTFLVEIDSCAETRVGFYQGFSKTRGMTISANSSWTLHAVA